MELVFTDASGKTEKLEVFNFPGRGVSLGMYNTDDSIEAFAHSSFQVNIFRKCIVIFYFL